MNLAAFRLHGVRLLLTGVSLLLAGSASSGVYRETTDAPALPPGQFTTAASPLERIHGFLGDSVDVDLYRIAIFDPGGFSATVVTGGDFDAQLFLFNPAALGVTHDDDTPPGGTSSSTLATPVPAPGIYLLAISAFNRDPTSGGLRIWSDNPVNVERPPDGPGAFGPLSGWTGEGLYGAEYWIELTGCNALDPSGSQPGMWNESADAPDVTPGQISSGAGGLSWIEGMLADGADVDVFGIRVTDAAFFSATTFSLPGFDTQLFLFDPLGTAIAFNDDSPLGATGCSRIEGDLLPGPGDYLLGVAAFDREPRSSGALPIWLERPYSEERAPDGPGAPGPLASWGPISDYAAPYEIALTSATFASPTTSVPDRNPASLAATLSAFPSPSGARVRIRASLPASARGRLAIYDGTGRRVRSLAGGERLESVTDFEWDGRDDRGDRVSAGVYFARLTGPSGAAACRIVLLNGGTR